MPTPVVIADRYRVERELGRGSFGVTYLVRDVTLDRPVALKLAEAETELTARFRSEGNLLQTINNPHVGHVYDFGVFENRPYLAMEYVPGPTLREVLAKVGRLPVAAALTTIRAVATGLAAAHDQKFIHRDLKPANVILRGDSYANAVIVDFGVAGTLGDHGFTREGELAGTIFHMAPEQVQGLPQSAATDVYGAGVLLYWMIFGRQPFQGASLSDLFSKILTEEPEIPPDPVIPQALRSLLVRCLAKDPLSRPQSARELLAELANVDDDDTLLRTGTHAARPAAAMQRPMPDLRRTLLGGPMETAPAAAPRTARRIAVIGFGVVVVILLLFFIFVRPDTKSARPNPQPPIVVNPQPTPPVTQPNSLPVLVDAGLIAGIVLVVAGIPLGLLIRKVLRQRRSRIDEEATRILFGAKSRDVLTETLAIEVDKLIQQLDRLDERILGISIAIMVQEFRSAKKTDARQKALMQMVELLEKVRYRLTPWYVRHEKLIAIVVSVLTCLSGAATAAANILKPSSHP